MRTTRLLRHAVIATATVAALTTVLLPGVSSARPASTGHLSKVERLFTGDSTDSRLIVDRPVHRIYVIHNNDSQIDAINTRTRHSTLLPGVPGNGATVNRHTGDLYEYGSLHGSFVAGGLRIFSGAKQLARYPRSVSDVIDLAHGMVGALIQPGLKAPQSAFRLEWFDGARRLGATQVCAGLSQSSRVARRVAYNPTTNLLYLACPDGDSHAPSVQVFRGAKLLRTYHHVPANFFKIDQSRNELFAVSDRQVTLFRGAQRIDSIAGPRATSGSSVSPARCDLDVNSGLLYIAAGGAHASGALLAVRATKTGLRQSAKLPGGARSIVVNQRTDIAYVERHRDGQLRLDRYLGTSRLGSLVTNVDLVGYDASSEDVVASTPHGVELIAGTHTSKPVLVGANPKVVISAAHHRLYAMAHGVITVLRTSP